MNMDELPDDNPAERAQAAALRDQTRAGGLRFEAYLPPALADWLLDHIERGRFADPGEAAFLIFGGFRDMEPHQDLRDELLRRMLDASAAALKSAQADHDIFAELDARLSSPRPEAARWQKVAQ